MAFRHRKGERSRPATVGDITLDDVKDDLIEANRFFAQWEETGSVQFAIHGEGALRRLIHSATLLKQRSMKARRITTMAEDQEDD